MRRPPATGRLFGRVRVIGVSMLPAYSPGDLLLCRRIRPSAVTRGMVVVIDAPGNSPFEPGSKLIKRVAGVAGDRVPGELVGQDGPVQVPEGCLVLLGDNEQASYDSQSAGRFFSADEVRSKVLLRLSSAAPGLGAADR